MQAARRKRLESKGWKLGGAKDLLNLSAEEESFIEIRLRLADGLKKRRMRQKITQTELAKAVHSSQSRVAKMEAGDPTVSIDLLVRTLLTLGASPKDVAKLISGATARAA